MKLLIKKSCIVTVLSAVMIAAGPTTIAQTSSLPELGDSATQHLSSAQEKLIGQEFHRWLLGNRYFVEDFELRAYLQSLGDIVGSSADLREMDLVFNLLIDNNLNAFAVPGGYITFNTGLLMATENESELASVIGHEIAHLTQRHLPRMIARQNENRIPAIAAIIGSILIGGQAGLAGITLTNATMASDQLAYTRSFEREADSIGIQMLAKSGFDPRAMAEFFNKLERYTRHDNTEVPEFLLTHPLSYTRVAESEARAREYPKVNHEDSFEYLLAKAKIRALFVERDDDPDRFLEDQIESTKGFEKDAGKFGLAVHLTEERKTNRAQEIIDELLSSHPDHPWIVAAHAKNELAAKNIDRAIEILSEYSSNEDAPYYIYYYLADAYLTNKQPEQAKKIARYQIRRRPNDFVMYNFLSRANADLGNLAEAHQSDAEIWAILGDYKTAIQALDLAAREASSEGYLAQSIQSRKRELEEKYVIAKKISKG